MAKIITKLYKYDSSQESNGYRGEDFSKYCLIGDTETDNLDDTLDTAEITLVGLPFREEFAPTTKFILEKWQEGGVEPVKSLHLCVSSDAVEQPIMSDETYFNHSLSLIEAGVLAQQRLVDNIAVTYRLKDVTLEQEPTYNPTQTAPLTLYNAGTGTDPKQEYWSGTPQGVLSFGHKFEWVMPDWYTVNIGGGEVSPSWNYWRYFYLNQEIPVDQTSKRVELPIPMLACYYTKEFNDRTQNYWDLNGYCSIDVIVEKSPTATEKWESVVSYTVNPASDTPNESGWTRDDFWGYLNTIGGVPLQSGEILSRRYFDTYKVGTFNQIKCIDMYEWSKLAEWSPTKTGRLLSFDIEAGFTYRIKVKRHSFVGLPNREFWNYVADPSTYSKSSVVRESWREDKPNNTAPYPVNDTTPSVFIQFNTVLVGQRNQTAFKTAPPANALDLFNKAQLTTQNVLKVDGIKADETPTTFYLENEDRQELNNTQIVENFYNQKNLHEIQMDIGKYIHARPQIRFGKDDRLVCTWKKYGLTDKFENSAQPISIFNSRFVEEYISACSSYVTNMVQLGGLITEYVAPKSSSEDFLVYNDVAEIKTSKNIIELVELVAIRKSDNRHEDITENTFEENIYNLLQPIAQESMNKGLAIYYTLGTNIIKGLTYQLPTINQGDADNDYAIKRILGRKFQYATADWKNIKINDFLFKISYRTKDTLRSDQARPDLRKYLLNSKYDRIPLHNQFNNQTDTVVDSLKFGNNIYGKLIRTGNTVFTTQEWVYDLNSLKKSGQLYSVFGNLYYVARVVTTYYTDHAVCEVEYSKDFNRLSQIIGIPSEPRFYEISEQSLIRREVSFNDYIVLGTKVQTTDRSNSFMTHNAWNYVNSLLFQDQEQFPKYAVTMFKSDKDKYNPLGNDKYLVKTCHALCSYSIENTLTLEWDMVDNFSAGDQVLDATGIPETTEDKAYKLLYPFRYADVYGRCDLVDFAIVDEYDFGNEDVMRLPANPIDLVENADNVLFGNEEPDNYGRHDRGIVLLKDNREALSFNYNLQVLTESDRFVLSSYMWQQGKQNVKLGLLREEANKISVDFIPNNSFQTFDIPLITIPHPEDNYIEIDIENSVKNYCVANGINLETLMSGVKGLVVYSETIINENVASGAKYFVMARNVGDLTLDGEDNKLSNWYISNYDKSTFERQ